LPFSLQKGASVQSEGKSLVIKKANKEIYFSHKIPMEISFLLATKTVKTDENGLIISDSKQMNIVKYQRVISHPSLDITKKTAARLGIKLTGQMKSCEDCILAKIKRMNLNRVSLTKSKIPGEILLLYVNYIKEQSLGGKNMWLLIQD
jgi:hypothetical protein